MLDGFFCETIFQQNRIVTKLPYAKRRQKFLHHSFILSHFGEIKVSPHSKAKYLR